MLKQILHLITFLLIISCERREIKEAKEFINDNSDISINQIDSLAFNFSAKRINNSNEYINLDIKATVFNNGSDTVYFLTMTCFGEQHSLRYDTSKFELISLTTCVASNPTVEQIAPNGQNTFEAYFRDNGKEDSIKLGFDIYRVDKSFKITKENMNKLKIFNRPADQQTIIWAKEPIIK
jgi:hypothetical protein